MADTTTTSAAAEPKGYAIIETGGKQYRVSVGDKIMVEKLAAEEGSDVSIDKVLFVGGVGDAKIGAPYLDGASVNAPVAAQGKGETIVVFKYKPKKRYRRRIGHRQPQTWLTITGINA